MALINCPECNKQVSGSAKSCPHCGMDLSEPEGTFGSDPFGWVIAGGVLVAMLLPLFQGC